MAISITLEPFDIEDRDRCKHVIAILVPLFEAYYLANKKDTDPPFDFNFTEFVTDWWKNEKVLLLAYEGSQLVGFMFAKISSNLFTSITEFRVDIEYVLPEFEPAREHLRVYAQQLLPLYKCVRVIDRRELC